MELVQAHYRGYERRDKRALYHDTAVRVYRVSMDGIHGSKYPWIEQGTDYVERREQRPPGALASIRVVDLTRILAGPFCTQLLAGMGADVIKIETGEVTRAWTNDGSQRKRYLQFNRNKRSVVLDLYTNRKDTHVIKSAVVVKHNRGVCGDGLHPEFLEQLNPQLIHGSVNGWDLRSLCGQAIV